MKIILTGATGYVGEGTLLELLKCNAVGKVLSVSRKPTGIKHEKLEEYLVSDFMQLKEGDEHFKGYDAVFFIAGITSVGTPKELYHNQEWVERALPAIKDCRIPTELIPHTPDGQPVSMNLRCDDTFVEDAHWHEQAQRYSDFVSMSHDKRMLLLEFGVGFNTPVIIRFPFEQMAARFPDATLVRFNRDYPQLTTQGISRYVAFSEGVEQIVM